MSPRRYENVRGGAQMREGEGAHLLHLGQLRLSRPLTHSRSSARRRTRGSGDRCRRRRSHRFVRRERRRARRESDVHSCCSRFVPLNDLTRRKIRACSAWSAVFDSCKFKLGFTDVDFYRRCRTTHLLSRRAHPSSPSLSVRPSTLPSSPRRSSPSPPSPSSPSGPARIHLVAVHFSPESPDTPCSDLSSSHPSRPCSRRQRVPAPRLDVKLPSRALRDVHAEQFLLRGV